MRWFRRATRSPIGVDVGTRSIKAVQVSGAGAGCRVEAAAVLPRGDSTTLGEDDVMRFCEVLYRQGFSGNDVVLAAPAVSLMSGAVELPPRHSGAPIAQIARTELAELHKCNAAVIEAAYWELPVSASTTHRNAAMPALAVACPYDDANELLDVFEAVNLNVVALDVHWLALARSCAALIGKDASLPEDSIAAVLDLGWQAGRLIVLRRGTVVYERHLLDIGGRVIWKAMHEQFRLDAETVDYLLEQVGLCDDDDAAGPAADRRTDPQRRADGDRRTQPDVVPDDDMFAEPRRAMRAHAEALVRELQRSLSYAAQQCGDAYVDQVLLVGGGAGIPGLAEHVASVSGMQVAAAPVSKLARVRPGLESACGSAVLAGALGLALY